ncbi:MAG: hypothetical protein ACW96U_00830 [Candidatus Heimdallarchaeaceae archaeon]|jgi:hypothetical protein
MRLHKIKIKYHKSVIKETILSIEANDAEHAMDKAIAKVWNGEIISWDRDTTKEKNARVTASIYHD